MTTQSELDLQARLADMERQLAELAAKVNPLYSGGMDRYIHSGYIQFDGVPFRWSTDGMQVQTSGGQDAAAIRFVYALKAAFDSTTEVLGGQVSGQGTTTQGLLSVGASDRVGDPDMANAPNLARTRYEAQSGYAEIRHEVNDANGGVVTCSFYYHESPTWGLFELDDFILRLATKTADPTVFPFGLDGAMWYRTDTDKYRVRANSATRNLALEDTLIHGDGSELTIATGVITITTGYHRVDTQSDAASDDLDTVSGGTTGQILVLRAENDARSVVAKDGTGNLKLAGDCTLDNSEDTLTLIYNGTNWLELARSNNGA